MDSERLVSSFADFAKEKKIEKPIIIKILNDVFKAIIIRKYGTDENFDIVINLEKGDLQIWRFREIVLDDSDQEGEPDKISLSEARQIETDFEVGEEVAEEINISSFGRRAILTAKQTLLQKVKDLEKDNLFQKYSNREGELITAEVYQILAKEIVLIDEENKELILPKSEQISKDRFNKGDLVKAVISKIDLYRSFPKIILSRTSPVFLERLLESNVPEISDGLITIKKIVRVPGERAKVAVESYDDRIDPVGACVGMKGSRIYNIVRELRNENIDIINYTENENLYLARALNPARITSSNSDGERIAVYLNPDQVSLAIGKGGQNIKLASRLLGKEIDVYREVNKQDEDVHLDEFQDELDSQDIETLKKIGLESAKAVLGFSKEDLLHKSGITRDKLDQIYSTLESEFEEKSEEKE